MTEPVDFGYDSYLSQVPEALRGQIEPAFKSYSEELKNKVNGQYSQFDPLKEYFDQGFTPDHVGVGLNLLQEINTNPQNVFEALLKEYPDLAQPQQTPQFTPGQIPPVTPGQQQQTPDYNIDPGLQQRLDQQEQLIALMFQGFQNQQQSLQQSQEAAQEQAELDQFRTQLDQVAPEDKYPRQFILSYISQGQTPEQAVKSWTDWKTSELQQQRSSGSPLVAPAGGGVPSQEIDTSKLSDVDRRSLITQYLERANQQR